MVAPKTEVSEAKSERRQKNKSHKRTLVLALTVAVAGMIGCAVLNSMIHEQKAQSKKTKAHHAEEITTLKLEFIKQIEAEQEITKNAKASEIQAKTAKKIAESREKKNQAQLVSLGVANDHLLAWMMRDHSKDLPELKKSTSSRDTLVRELHQFLKITEGHEQFQPVRARIMLQLAELEIYQKNPVKADPLLDSAVAAWTDAGIQEPGHAYRIARARLACLIQALDQQKHDLATRLLPKARQAAQANPSNDDLENKRLNAVLHVIDGRMIQSKDPAKALQHFQTAIKDMQGIQRTLTEHIIVRSDLARYTLEAANLAETLNRTDDADRLRGEAATALEKLLKTNPNLQLPKVQLAQTHIMSANVDIREGNATDGAKKLAKAEKLLATLPATDTSPNGAAMQIAAAKGLRAVLLRDAGKNADAQRMLNEAIQLSEKILTAQNEKQAGSNEPLYRLAVLHWQLAGLIGDSGDKPAELRQGKKAADLMEDLLKKDAGKHDNAIRRGLGYLYGDLGHTAAQQGDQKAASTHFKHAAIIWQSLINRYGQQEEYTDGLKWSQTRQREVGRDE